MHGLTIYKSSAGSGKTYTLVKEYLKLVLQRPSDYKHILAITFTNKATEEMKNRIIRALIELIEDKNPNLEKRLREEINNSLDIKKSAQQVLNYILHDYSNFSVCTIDSFFHKIIRATAKEMRLPLRFDIEMDTDRVVAEITDNLFQEVGKNKELTNWLYQFMILKINDDKGWKIEQDIHQIAKELFKERFNTSDTELILTADFVKVLRSIKKDFESKMKSLAERAMVKITTAGLTISDFAHGSRGVIGYFDKVRGNLYDINIYKPGIRVLEALENPVKWYVKSSLKKDEVERLVEDCLQIILGEMLAYYRENYSQYVSVAEVLKFLYVYGIISNLQEKLKKYRDEKDILLMSDTNMLLKNFISQSDTPFIFEKVGTAYKHFLIDEFQDTSNLQWHNLKPLIKNAISDGNSAMIVGDVKQSIYRWRGGNMQLLLNGIKEDLKEYSSITKESVLNINYRSKKNIILFNNEFFKKASDILGSKLPLSAEFLNIAYANNELSQQAPEKDKEGGYINISLIKEKLTNWKEIALQNLLEILKKVKEDNYKYKDVVILVRKNTEGNTIANFLFDNGFKKIVSPESLLISSSPNIQFIINLFSYLNNPSDNIVKTQILYYYLNYINEKPLKKSLHSIFTDFSNKSNTLFNNHLPHEFIKNTPSLIKLPIYDLTEHLIQIFKLNSSPDVYIQRFQDLVLEFSSKDNLSLSNFIEWWEEYGKNSSVILPEDEDAISIMTIHKAKGLQFPIVIIPFMDWKLLPDNRDILWVSSAKAPFDQVSLLPVKSGSNLMESYFNEDYNKELTQSYIDNLNILYVAFTRPEDRLYIISQETTNDKVTTAAELLKEGLNKLNHFSINEMNLFYEYEMGETCSKQHDQSPSSYETLNLDKYPSSKWQSKFAISSESKKLWFSFLEENIKLQKLNYGILIHQILANIQTVDESEDIIDSLYHKGIIEEKEKQELRHRIEDLFKIQEVVQWFSNEWKAKIEREITLPSGEILRPDRVLIKDKKAVVIDFKTGKVEDKHQHQVNKYAQELSKMGYSPIEKYILYTSDKLLHKID